jgi:hypothetical protein
MKRREWNDGLSIQTDRGDHPATSHFPAAGSASAGTTVVRFCTVRKVDLSQVLAALPPGTPTVTPQDRDKNIRKRRSELQQRPLW